MATFSQKPAEVEKKWILIDAEGLVVGRLATLVANRLRGKHKATFTPHVDDGDNVIIINADKVHVSSNKREREMRYRHSGYPGGLKRMTLGRSLEVHPERVVEETIRGMMPHNRLSRASIKKLHVFAGSEHPYASPKPESYEIKAVDQ